MLTLKRSSGLWLWTNQRHVSGAEIASTPVIASTTLFAGEKDEAKRTMAKMINAAAKNEIQNARFTPKASCPRRPKEPFNPAASQKTGQTNKHRLNEVGL